jgi:hypothetical protein
MSEMAPPHGEGAVADAHASRRVSVPSRRSRWGTVAALSAAVVVFGVVDGFPLVALPLGVLLIGISVRQRWWWLGVAALVWALALGGGGGGIHTMGRGWGLLLGGGFLAVTLLRPRWFPFSRALAAVAVAFGAAAAWLAQSGAWARLDQAMAEHFRSIAMLTSREMRVRFPDTGWAENLAAMAGRIADLQALLFPALLALQSLAALVLVWWAFSRSRSRARRASRTALRPLRDFRFNDSLIWLALGGLVLIVAPLGEQAARVGFNVLLFMAALYVLRGVAVFVFLARGAPTMLAVMLGAAAALFFYPLVFVAALLVGLGDTWLDVRGRLSAAATRA